MFEWQYYSEYCREWISCNEEFIQFPRAYGYLIRKVYTGN